VRTPRGKARRRWLWGLAASPLVVAGLIAVPAATHASAGIISGPYTFQDVATGKCLDSSWSANNPGDPDMGAAYTRSCNGGKFQSWTVDLLYDIGNGPDEVINIIDAQTGKCLDSSWSANNPGDPDMGAAYTKSCNGGTFQQWVQSPTADYSAWTWQNVATGKCLDSSWSANNPGDPDMGALYTKSCNGGTFQQWH
jgi:hypothetical protein